MMSSIVLDRLAFLMALRKVYESLLVGNSLDKGYTLLVNGYSPRITIFTRHFSMGILAGLKTLAVRGLRVKVGFIYEN